MNTLPEFFQGPIAQDFHDILDAELDPDLSQEAAGSKSAAKKKKPAKKDHPPACNTTIACSTEVAACKTKKKADAFLPGVAGWSSPPAPPAF